MTGPGEDLRDRLAALPEGSWVRCGRCRATVYGARFRRAARVCPECGQHARLSLAERLDVLVDPGSFVEQDPDLASTDPLSFVDSQPYRDRLAEARRRTGRPDAAVHGSATVGGHPVVLAVLDFDFMGGSMGSVVGERVTRAAELATARGVPLVTCSSSGGARMQEGIVSLLQMAKVAAAIRQLASAGQPHLSVLVDPVYGGVSASFASLADVIVAEADARAGFAGPQVIAQTLRERLPDGFQTADFLLEHGHIDAVVPRAGLRGLLARVVAFHAAAGRPGSAGGVAKPGAGAALVTSAATEPGAPAAGPGGSRDAEATDPWERVRLARHPHRPVVDDYLAGIFEDVVEIRGDRQSEDDPAVVAGLAMLDGRPVVVTGHRKGRGTAEAVAHNFGMPVPAGYRKARRAMEYAERFGIPLVMFVDTPGAYPGVRAERANQSGAIAANLAVLAGLAVPVVAVVVGEGGSGGALALGVADRLVMLENATLSVISPEGCATILFRDAGQAPRAARALGLTAADLARLGLVDDVLPEPPGGAQHDPAGTVTAVGAALRRHLAELAGQDPGVLVGRRLARLRAVGPVSGGRQPAAPGGSEPAA